MDKGYIKIDRSLADWRWYQDPNTLRVWLHLLIKANWEDKDFENITVHRGSIITSHGHLAKELGLTVKNVRTALEHLKTTGEVAITRHPKYLEISIENYDAYQSAGNQTAIKRQSNGNQTATTKDIKTLKALNKNIYARARGELQNVFLTDDEVEDLKGSYPDQYKRLIDDVGLYKAKSGTEYASDYAAVVSFAINQGIVKALPDLGYEIETEYDFKIDESGYEVAVPRTVKVFKDGSKEPI